MEKEATTMIEKESANIMSGILIGSTVGIVLWAVMFLFIYIYLV